MAMQTVVTVSKELAGLCALDILSAGFSNSINILPGFGHLSSRIDNHQLFSRVGQ